MKTIGRLGWGLAVLALSLAVIACGTTPPTATPTTAPDATPTRYVFPTAVDTFYGDAPTYSRRLGKRTQTIRLGVSPDFATRPVLPLYGLALADPKFADRLFEAVTRNHFYRWQEAEWATRALISYEDFSRELTAGADLSYPAMDTSNGGTGAHTALVNPAGNLDLLLIPRHDGFVTFEAGPTDPGLSIKNTIQPDGSVTVRVPIVYAQLISYKPGDAQTQVIVSNSIVIALMELGIPADAIANNNLPAINTWWESSPDKDLHRAQYTRLQKLLTDDATQKPILQVLDQKP